MSKPLDLADKYDSTLDSFDPCYPNGDPYEDDEPTVKINMAAVLPKVHVSEEKSYPGIGLAIVFIGGGLFWLTVYFLIFGR